MSFFLENRNRIVIPTWREYKVSSLSQEHIPLRNKITEPREKNQFLIAKLNDWNEHQNLPNSLELVNSAYASGHPEIAFDAAKFLKQHGNNFPSQLLKIISEILGEEHVPENPSSVRESTLHKLVRYIGNKLHLIRQRLVDFPDNPFQWLELARLHSILGNAKKAEKALAVAMKLSLGLNRYIVRATSRFYYHIDDYERSHNIVKSYPFLKIDPWLMATEISYARKLERFSTNIKAGIQILNSNNYSNESLSELASMIGTVELYEGSVKNARKWTNKSLNAPNDNSLAQAEWISRHISDVSFNPWLSKVEYAYEARAHELLHNKEYQSSMEEGFNWVIDQPFSKRAVTFASYIACGIIGDYDHAIEICKFGLMTNPNSFLILNNLAYSLACNNQTNEAAKYLEKMSLSFEAENEKVVFHATDGLIDYRSGKLESGKEKYLKAIDLASKQKDENVVLRAETNFLREQLIAKEITLGAFKEKIQKIWSDSKTIDKEELKAIMKTIIPADVIFN
jgi:tetratricopeptide (TPR) repeat protein